MIVGDGLSLPGIETVSRCVCQVCRALGPEVPGKGSRDAIRAARAIGWCDAWIICPDCWRVFDTNRKGPYNAGPAWALMIATRGRP